MSEEPDDTLTPRELLERYGLEYNVSPLVQLVQTNLDSSSTIQQVIEFAMALGLHRGILTHQPSFVRIPVNIATFGSRLAE